MAGHASVESAHLEIQHYYHVNARVHVYNSCSAAWVLQLFCWKHNYYSLISNVLYMCIHIHVMSVY